MDKFTTLLFDLDGTLTDSQEGLVNCMKYAMDKMGYDMPDDAQKTAEMFDILLGDNLTGRKQYIVEHGAEYTDTLDLS